MSGVGTPAAPAVSRAGSTRKCSGRPLGWACVRVGFESPPASEPGASASTWTPAWSWSEDSQQQIRRHTAGPGPTSRARFGSDHKRSGCPNSPKCRICDHNGHYGVAPSRLLWTSRPGALPKSVGTQGNPRLSDPSKNMHKGPTRAVMGVGHVRVVRSIIFGHSDV